MREYVFGRVLDVALHTVAEPPNNVEIFCQFLNGEQPQQQHTSDKWRWPCGRALFELARCNTVLEIDLFAAV